ncbi:hypothetical protein O181_116761 [Austropuccinia psidii MF-1]|uniref:Uncharacterized protein n=1 Tax=Austropuccinia psidii MF-1 TaxID=1389203 RepID=A0A9Q3KBE3_9BASI|nr:hypothetical protein [Austropuccinia psidii MF-1]
MGEFLGRGMGDGLTVETKEGLAVEGLGWEGEVLDWFPAELSTTSTSSPSSSSLPSASGSTGLPPTAMGPPTLVHLATSLFLEPITNAKCQYHNQSRKPPYLQLEYPGVASETGTSLPKGPSFLLQKYLLTLEIEAPGCWQGFFPTKERWNLKNWGL